MNNTADTIQSTLESLWLNFVNYIPQFFAGLVLLLVGLLVASVLKSIVWRILRTLNISKWIENAEGIFTQAKDRTKGDVWPYILAELVKWTVIILFLLPAFDAWGLNRVTQVLNQLIVYLPNVFVAVIVGFIGFGLAKFVFELINTAASGFGSSIARVLANIARYAIVFFTTLVVLNQLGVADNLIQILFTGIVGMLALAGGLAFGLGGRDAASRLLDSLTRSVQERRAPMK